MTWLSSLNPTPAFPEYSGPYKVGSVDVEIPVSELDSPSPAPDSGIPTVAFRIFYPCEPDSSERPVRWIPNPQRGYVSAYARFLGASNAFSHIFALFPQLLYYVTIPVHRNARMLPPPTTNKRWPVLVFSHGLGGSRNAYSHITGSLASHGMIVIAPDHRDGSAPISYIRKTATTDAKTIDYRTLPHSHTPEVWQQRDEQLSIRLWELGCIHDALLKIDQGTPPTNLDPNRSSSKNIDTTTLLSIFAHNLDIHTPGSITWAGHSFGGATMLQFTKSVFYRPSAIEAEKASYTPLFTPSPSSPLISQITPSTPVALLDMWTLPLVSPATRWLWERPMPCYAPSGPGGTVLLSVLSEAFVNWRSHLVETKRALSANPAATTSTQPASSKPGPRFFYPASSAHLSQSDFGILFPWATKKIFKAEEPDRTLKLNVRAILQVMREAGLEVAPTSSADMEVEDAADEDADWEVILDPVGGVRGWIALRTDFLSQEAEMRKEREGEMEGEGEGVEVVVEGEALGQMQREETRRKSQGGVVGMVEKHPN
ncbi:hypothetical protein K490DRAFT_33812 [Saccharata proteae CBS 121410]|uniref:Putative phospholipase n=1 Tax=Saccharata proteae CBS 121410 TaxID=1314787 RepID=A0A9P4I305_9PEZI|nr:hypothetical protein K490DRAFT_33812 [Saccharata proteae CBS 121410]